MELKKMRNMKSFGVEFFKNNKERIIFLLISVLLIFNIVILHSHRCVKQVDGELHTEAEREKDTETNATNNVLENKAVPAKSQLINGKYASLKERDDTFTFYLSVIYEGNSTIKYGSKKIKTVLDDVRDNTQLKLPNMFYDLTIIGDSYGVHLYNYINKKYGYRVTTACLPGHSITENIKLYQDEINKCEKNIIVFATSVNDVLRQTDLETFKNKIEFLYKLAYDKKKIMVVMSNCDFLENGKSANASLLFEYIPKYYDTLTKKSASYYPNVLYIDMNDLAVVENLVDEVGLHYNDYFYEQFINRMIGALRSA